MKLKLKEDPKEWRKSALMIALGVAMLGSLLCWRRVLPVAGWAALLCVLAVVALAATLNPALFRGYYRFSSRAGFVFSQMLGKLVLLLLFFIILVPMGLVMRAMGKDALRLRRPPQVDSYWNNVREKSSLEQMF